MSLQSSRAANLAAHSGFIILSLVFVKGEGCAAKKHDQQHHQKRLKNLGLPRRAFYVAEVCVKRDGGEVREKQIQNQGQHLLGLVDYITGPF